MQYYGSTDCVECGTNFHRGSGNAKRCRPCAMKRQGTTGVGFLTKSCTRCGVDYLPTGSTQTYCETCKPIARKENNIKSLKALRLSRGVVPIGSVIRCAACDAEFVFVRGVKKLCDSCQNIKRKTKAREYAKKNPDKIKRWAKTAHENNKLGGSRKLALARDTNTCQKCGKHPANVVHHIDCFGENSGSANNTLENLVTLCASCHAGVHATIDRFTRERHPELIAEAYAVFDYSHWSPQA